MTHERWDRGGKPTERPAGETFKRWDRPGGILGGCPHCGATEDEACRAYTPESDACHRQA